MLRLRLAAAGFALLGLVALAASALLDYAPLDLVGGVLIGFALGVKLTTDAVTDALRRGKRTTEVRR